jgi:hypothetical protein
MPTHNTSEFGRSAPARIIPTGTVTIPWEIDVTAANGDKINLCKVPAGAVITDVLFSCSHKVTSLTVDVGTLYTDSADATQDVADSLIDGGNLETLFVVRPDVASATKGAPFTVPDSAKSDCTVYATLAGATPDAAAIYRGTVCYTLQTQERFVMASDQ